MFNIFLAFLFTTIFYSCATISPVNKVSQSNNVVEVEEGLLTCQEQLENGGDYSICRHVESAMLIINLPIICNSADKSKISTSKMAKKRINWNLGIYSGVANTDGQGFLNLKIPASQKHFADELVLKGRDFSRVLSIARTPVTLKLSSSECNL